MEYNNNFVLWRIGDHIRKILKVDCTTCFSTRGNYTRICVEVGLMRPLLAKFKLRRKIRHYI
ncbi:hypothetical protein NC653_011120 [Populus alba x Populus x berolinensis]|uniref:Uncharacterized protein n=1 Tax=Populus alba x Populus x berolinensis TaxID=444605 RepID=A0AAD6W5Y7_9ROSI|nr:hypothetical protein NC653_011120 [Populus alba x Populus x berolinensis]